MRDSAFTCLLRIQLLSSNEASSPWVEPELKEEKESVSMGELKGPEGIKSCLEDKAQRSEPADKELTSASSLTTDLLCIFGQLESIHENRSV